MSAYVGGSKNLKDLEVESRSHDPKAWAGELERRARNRVKDERGTPGLVREKRSREDGELGAEQTGENSLPPTDRSVGWWAGRSVRDRRDTREIDHRTSWEGGRAAWASRGWTDGRGDCWG